MSLTGRFLGEVHQDLGDLVGVRLGEGYGRGTQQQGTHVRESALLEGDPGKVVLDDVEIGVLRAQLVSQAA